MNLTQSLGAAAAALFAGIYPLACGWSVSSAQEVVAQSGAMTRETIRAAARELADILAASYVFPDQADRYAAHLRQRASAGAYDQMTEPAALAAALQSELRAVHEDAHLRISPVGAAETRGRRIVQGSGNRSSEFAEAEWLSEGVAYLRINSLPGGDDVGARMSAILAPFESADALIIDVRACPGGTLPAMDALFARLYAEPTFVMTMDTRSGAEPRMEEEFEDSPTLRRVPGPRGIVRYEHWAQPTTPVSGLADARVFVLTGRTGSACEHLSQALRETGRATLIGSNTGGAGHYGSGRTFGGGRFEMFLPIGNSYAPGAQSWEGVGVAPHIRVAPEAALEEALRVLREAPASGRAP
jgi:hypothetical protein